MSDNVFYINTDNKHDDEPIEYPVKISTYIDKKGFFNICYDDILIGYIRPDLLCFSYLPLNITKDNENYLKRRGVSISIVDGQYYVGEHKDE